MLFNSYEFILVFLPIVFFIYFGLNKAKLATIGKAWLVVSSLFFYGWWNPNYLILIVFSMIINYSIGSSLVSNKNIEQKNKSQKTILVFGLIFNLSLLAYYKYTVFLILNLNALGFGLPVPQIILPLAISFFTFQQIAYLIDSYSHGTNEYDLLNYCLFVTFFPQLIAGPIVHHKEMMPQFLAKKNLVIKYKNIAIGTLIFFVGLFKKVVLADQFSVWANNGHMATESLNFFEAWVTSLSYTFQLYFDFSGYTDMAIGVSLLFNIKLPTNFNSPYKSYSIQDFWRSWHITLSRFLRDYIYIPMGGNKVTELRICFNLFITFLIGGIWHGASWMFIIWGCLHGIALIIHRLWQKLNISMPKAFSWFLTFNFVNIAWVFFRAEDINAAVRLIGGMFSLSNIVLPAKLETYLLPKLNGGIEFGNWLSNVSGSSNTIALLIFGLTLTLFAPNSKQIIEKFKPNLQTLLYTILLSFSFYMITKNQPFLYFDF